MNDVRLLSARGVARAVGVANTVVLEWLQSGNLPAFKVGKSWKVNPGDLRQFLERLAQEGAQT